MPNIKFEYNGKLSDGRFFDEDSKKKVTVELEDTDLSVNEMLEEFMNFMKAIGYSFDIGDHFEVVNDFSKEPNNPPPRVEDYKIDFSKYDTIVDEGGTVIGTVGKLNDAQPTPEQIAAEVDRLRDTTFGLSEEALELTAYHNLTRK